MTYHFYKFTHSIHWIYFHAGITLYATHPLVECLLCAYLSFWFITHLLLSLASYTQYGFIRNDLFRRSFLIFVFLNWWRLLKFSRTFYTCFLFKFLKKKEVLFIVIMYFTHSPTFWILGVGSNNFGYPFVQKVFQKLAILPNYWFGASSQIRYDVIDKGILKLTLQKIILKNVLLNPHFSLKTNQRDLVDFWCRKSTLKVQFVHFFTRSQN